MKKALPFLWCPTLLILLSVVSAQRVTIAAHKEVSSIPIIDTHIHLYDTTRPQGLPWPPPTDKVLYRPVLPADFDKICQDNQVAATVIVEASEWLDDNQWVLDLVKHNPKRYIALVGSLEIGTPEFSVHLKRLSRDPRFVGVRLRERPRENEFFNEDVWRDLKLMAELNQTLDVLMFNFSLNDIDMIAKKVPTLKILSNHVAGADIDGKAVGPPATVPDVVGLEQTVAESAILADGFTVGTVTFQSSAVVPFGDVISQDPIAGTSAALGSPVNLVVSSGPPAQSLAKTHGVLAMIPAAQPRPDG